MTVKPVVPRDQARRDVEAAVTYYAREAGADVALSFVDSLRRAYQNVGARPATGASRFAHELDLPGLRTRKVGRFPYLVFYVERDDHIDVWRVLHGRRDIPAGMRQPD